LDAAKKCAAAAIPKTGRPKVKTQPANETRACAPGTIKIDIKIKFKTSTVHRGRANLVVQEAGEFSGGSEKSFSDA
jgi:hypothetical protein